MAILLVSYDLRSPNRNYEALYEAIKTYPGWAHPLESVWLINTVETTKAVVDKLRTKLDADDKIVAMSLAGNWTSLNLGKEVSEWMKTNVCPA